MRAAERSASSGPSPLIGRERELRLLDAALSRSPGVILVTGEAGVGKTRLLAEVSARRSTRWLVGQCRPQDSSPVAEALGISSDSNQDVLTALSTAGPVVLLIEDLHWAAPETLDLLRFLTSRIPPKVQIVLTSRGDLVSLAGTGPSRTTEIRVEPLDAHAVRDLAAQLLGLDLVPSAVTDELLRHSGGLPFAVEEFLRDIPVRQGALVEERVRRALAETPPPVALRASTAQTMQDASVACRRVICAAAVLTTAASEALLGAVSEVTAATLTTAIDDALAAGLLHEPRPGLYDVKHTLARRAIVAMIPPNELRRLHRQAAAALTSIDPPPHARVAEHARLGGKIRTWLTHAELAADRSGADVESAAEQFTAMLKVEALPWADRARLATKLGRIAMGGPWAEAITTLQSVLAESGVRSMARGRLRLALGLLLHDRAGEVQAGRRELAAAAEELGQDPESAAWALSALAVPSYGTEPMFEHRAWMQRALSLIGDTPDTDAQLAVRTNQARFRLALGEVDEAAGADVAAALAWLGKVRRSSALLDRAAENDDPYTLAVIAATRLRLAFAEGDWTLLRERLARVAGTDLPLVRAEIMLIDGRLRLARGDVAAGKDLLQEVIARTEFGPLPVHAAAVAACPGADLEQCLSVVRRKSAWATAGDLALVACRSLLRDGRFDDARRLAGEFSGAHTATLVDGLVNQSPDLCKQAAAQYQALSWHYYERLALEEHGLVLLAQGNPQPLTEVAAAYESMGARGDARRCREALQTAGLPVTRKRGRRSYGNTLSPRELQVAQLAAQGHTNAQIASTLALSVSTVEDHITSTLRKLNVPSRHHLANRLG